MEKKEGIFSSKFRLRKSVFKRSLKILMLNYPTRVQNLIQVFPKVLRSTKTRSICSIA
jgi:hypothetical protein